VGEKISFLIRLKKKCSLVILFLEFSMHIAAVFLKIADGFSFAHTSAKSCNTAAGSFRIASGSFYSIAGSFHTTASLNPFIVEPDLLVLTCTCT
jgi:hypothetical protein